jgi:hypothetical protein
MNDIYKQFEEISKGLENLSKVILYKKMIKEFQKQKEGSGNEMVYDFSIDILEDAIKYRTKCELEGIAEEKWIPVYERLPEDGIPYWDFDAPEIPEALRDASAGSLMASAFILLSTHTKDKTLSKACLDMAEKQIRTLASEEYLAEPGTNGDFLLKHSVGDMPKKREVDVPLMYADYYFIEALLRYKAL